MRHYRLMCGVVIMCLAVSSQAHATRGPSEGGESAAADGPSGADSRAGNDGNGVDGGDAQPVAKPIYKKIVVTEYVRTPVYTYGFKDGKKYLISTTYVMEPVSVVKEICVANCP